MTQHPSTQDPRRQQIVERAYQVFARYGYGRTTMRDLAEAAGLSRPGLYLVFPGKDQVFDAVIGWMGNQALRQLREEVAALPDLYSQLHHACLQWVLRGRRVEQSYPDAADFFNTQFDSVARLYRQVQDYLAELIAPHTGQGNASAAQLARLLSTSLRAIKVEARDETDLEHLIALQVRLLVASLPSGVP
ncbi:TetR/AcrR family transcriptional regulator [Deinococcus sp.]|uniref:TetR/AcrR family transcriptional regulator n=1 Tax=Deinococcus sp. TaxID=47478 RepID=UPI003CC66522